jgi:hypothetical protein
MSLRSAVPEVTVSAASGILGRVEEEQRQIWHGTADPTSTRLSAPDMPTLTAPDSLPDDSYPLMMTR